MSTSNGNSHNRPSYASEPIRLRSLELDRREQRLEDLNQLRSSCRQHEAGTSIDQAISTVNALVRSKALDDQFSVAVRDRWQKWSRKAKPARRDLASSATVQLKRDPTEDLAESEVSADSSGNDSSNESTEGDSEAPASKKARKATDGLQTSGTSQEAYLRQPDSSIDVRQGREELLNALDSNLPAAFRFHERQLMVYAKRLKPKFFNSLDRPFSPSELRNAIRVRPNESNNDQIDDPARKTASPTSASSVLTISFFAGSLDSGVEGDASGSADQEAPRNTEASSGQLKDDYVNKVAGDGPAGLKKTQTIEILSSQPLDLLKRSLFCWSNEQPERVGWRERLRAKASHDATPPSRPDDSNVDPNDDDETQALGSASEEDGQEARFARFTGKHRRTDTVITIENKLYGSDYRSGDEVSDERAEADYVTLLQRWKKRNRSEDHPLKEVSVGGDLDVTFDQLDIIRIGHPYWMLHQGDCVHCFVIENVRALRPEEAKVREEASPTTSGQGAIDMPSFPTITWICHPTILRFKSDNKANYGVGERILHAEGHVAYSYVGTGAPSIRGADRSQHNAAVGSSVRIRRKDESLLRLKHGRCFACSLRKAQYGILGGDRVKLRSDTKQGGQGDDGNQEATIEGLDEHLVTLCPPCMALLGFPTIKPDSSTQDDEQGSQSRTLTSEDFLRIDWEAINCEESRKDGWTIFPIY